MFDPYLIAALAALATLAGVVIVGGAALSAALFVREHLGRKHAERQAAALQVELAAYKQATGNKLYNRSLRDLGFATTQALLRVRAERNRLNDEWNVIEKILETGKKGFDQ